MQNNLFPVSFFFQFLNHRTTAYTPTINSIGSSTSPTGLAKLGSNSPVAPPPPGRPPGPVLEPSPSAYAKGKEEIGELKPELTSLWMLIKEPPPEEVEAPTPPPEEKLRRVLSDVRTDIGVAVVPTELRKLLPKLLVAENDEEALETDIEPPEKAAEGLALYVDENSNIFKKIKKPRKDTKYFEEICCTAYNCCFILAKSA